MVWGVPEKEHGVINAALGRHPLRRKDMSIVENDNPEENGTGKGKYAVTHWRVLRRFEFSALLACRLETGRTHQIRVHLTSIGHPVIGDPQYGKFTVKRLPEASEELSRDAFLISKPSGSACGNIGIQTSCLQENGSNFWHPVPDDFQEIT